MSYVVLARKWRPAQFCDIVGQGHIVRTLMNAIRSERIHQAYLMTGSRGIGKTSIARIFAKAVRCEQTKWEEPWLSSCDTCPSCKEIATGTSVDVIEIDGASNNGVDAVREIRENAKYLPASGSKKIYIIDEVHMLTTAAFNALLKTLEEPPAHVIFIFATTEPHKIPATILSRCQRFDLKRVTIAQVQSRLDQVTKSENVAIEPSALALIARSAEGSMRDALSILDQVVAFAGNTITAQSVRDSIGLIGSQALLGILRAVFARKPLEALALVDEAYQQGHDLRVLTRSLIELLHDAILLKIGATTPDLPEDERNELSAIADLRALEEIELLFQVLHQGVEWIARSPRPKVVIDVLLVKCATAEALIHIETGGNGGESRPIPAPDKQVASVQKKPVESTPQLDSQPVTTPLSVVNNVPPTGPNKDTTWEGFISYVRENRPLLASLLEYGICGGLPGAGSNILHISYTPDETYSKDQLQNRIYTEQLISLGKDFFKQHIQLKIGVSQRGESLAAKREREQKEREDNAKRAVQNHPIIQEAKSLFGGELDPVELSDVKGVG